MASNTGYERWSREQAWNWYKKQPWLVGCNFIPSTAVNQLEMWQKETFDPQSIERELGLAASIGFNTVRTYLHDLAWLVDRQGFLQRVERFLDIAAQKKIKPILVFFDDCWGTEFAPGKQPDPIPGVHNSGWVQSPGSKVVTSPAQWGRLEEYVGEVLERFAQDERVLMWDLYNEPGNNNLGERSLPLLRDVFDWARRAAPSQPLTAGLWYDNSVLNEFQLKASDIVTFHNYNDTGELERQIKELKRHGRPLVCTEYMARTRNSRFETHLPVFKRERVGCLNWGLVRGKTQTIFPWGSPAGAAGPAIWFHDIFWPDGTPYAEEEVRLIRSLTGSAC